MLLSSEPAKDGKHPLIPNLESLIDQKPGTLESGMVNLENRLQIAESLPPEISDSGLYVSEPEPEYSEDQEKVTFVENIAAGRPVFSLKHGLLFSYPVGISRPGRKITGIQSITHRVHLPRRKG
jgi:hypothetical protein